MAGRRTATDRWRRWLWCGGLVASIGALALGAVNPALAGGGKAIGDLSIFASAPYPGHPFGIAVDDERVYVSTSAGDFFAQHQNSDDERVFAYDEDGNLVQTNVIDTAQNSDMGLFGLALDGNHGRNHKLYVADMNGRILRLGTGNHSGEPEVFSQVPASTGLACCSSSPAPSPTSTSTSPRRTSPPSARRPSTSSTSPTSPTRRSSARSGRRRSGRGFWGCWAQ